MPSLVIEPAPTALVVVDLQKGVVGIATEPHSAPIVVRNAVRLAKAVRESGGLVVLVRVATSPDGRDALRPTLDLDAPTWSPRPSDWAAIIPELEGHAEDHVVTKKQWGAFYGTDLDLQLRRRGIRTLLLCGIATCFGVESTARDAFERGYDQIFVEDAMASRTAAEHEHVVTRIFPRMGRVRSTQDVLTALEHRRADQWPVAG